MDLAPGALITLARCLGYFDSHEEPEKIIPLINYASGAISAHCHREFIRSTIIRLASSYADKTIALDGKPILDIISLRYDTTRVFEVETEIDPTLYTFSAEKGIIRLTTEYDYGDDVFRVETIEGYDRVAYTQVEEPAAPIENDVWQKTDGTLLQFKAGVWTPFFGFVVPPDLEGACAEYVSYLKVRMRTGGAGTISRKRGYSFEGGQVDYELDMPIHIKNLLAPYVIGAF